MGIKTPKDRGPALFYALIFTALFCLAIIQFFGLEQVLDKIQPLMGLETATQAKEKADKNRHQGIERYIETHADKALNEMALYGIPASITLAQGILESRWGNSELARRANNHFGIKWAEGWEQGRYSVHSQEWNQETKVMESKLSVFRYYEAPEQSFRDHSEFLACRPRYASLFSLNTKDYRAWAKGLQTCGYATDPKYAEKLISLIERYDLQRYDTLTRVAQ